MTVVTPTYLLQVTYLDIVSRVPSRDYQDNRLVTEVGDSVTDNVVTDRFEPYTTH